MFQAKPKSNFDELNEEDIMLSLDESYCTIPYEINAVCFAQCIILGWSVLLNLFTLDTQVYIENMA